MDELPIYNCHVHTYKLADRVRVGPAYFYMAILDDKDFEGPRLCLAHFGGSEEWDKQLLTPAKVKKRGQEPTWVQCIIEMLCSGNYPNLYTDISQIILSHPRDSTMAVLALSTVVNSCDCAVRVQSTPRFVVRRIVAKLRRQQAERRSMRRYTSTHDDPD